MGDTINVENFRWTFICTVVEANPRVTLDMEKVGGSAFYTVNCPYYNNGYCTEARAELYRKGISGFVSSCPFKRGAITNYSYMRDVKTEEL